MSQKLTRRELLKILSLGVIGLVAPRPRLGVSHLDYRHDQTSRLGRVTRDKTSLFTEPDRTSDIVKTLFKDDIMRITKTSIGTNPSDINRIWYELNGIGVAHSGRIQPVCLRKNAVDTVIPERGCLGEVTVPFVDACSGIGEVQTIEHRFYYAATFWVRSREVDEAGKVWYKLWNDRYYYRYYYVPAETIRIVSETDLSPIAPNVPPDEKKLVVDLAKQTMTGYEYDHNVFMSRLSGGLRDKDGELMTPMGTHRITVKRPCRHMFMAPSEEYAGFSLPGVPWVSYFDQDGMAFHGTYWHNNFGVPQSAGCINLPPHAANWVYRWSNPVVPSGEYRHADVTGTLVIIQ